MRGWGKISPVAQMATVSPLSQPVSAHYPHLMGPGPLSRSRHSDARLLTGGTICQSGQTVQAQEGEAEGTWGKRDAGPEKLELS
jgi:hypothetical protein